MATSFFNTAFVRVPLTSYATIDNLDWAKLTQLIGQPDFLEALYIASPALFDEVQKLDTSREPNDKAKRVLYPVVRYLSRYATRCTPFGLFGGFSTLPVSNGATDVRTQVGSNLKKVVRLDMNYLCALAQDLEKHPALKPSLRFYPNTSLYAVNGQYRYVAYRYNDAGMRMHHLGSAEQNEYLDIVLKQARQGAYPGELAQAIASDEVSADEAAGFVEQVIELQLLVSELEPSLTGDDFLEQIIDTLADIYTRFPSDELLGIRTLLQEVKGHLKQVEQTGQDASTEKYTAIEEKLSQLPTPFDRKVLFQIDTYLPQTTGQLSKGLLNKLVAKSQTLMKLSPSGNPNLDEFVNRFTEKYEEEEVPLVIALDPEIGVGYPAGGQKADISPLVDGVVAGAPAAGSQSFTIPQEHRYLLQKVAEAQLSGAYEITISEDDLRTIEPRTTQLPLTNSAMFSVIREEGREKLVLDSFGGSNGMCLLGRFGHTDPSVLQLLNEISRAEDEAAPEVIFADVIHLPEARTGNVIIRPELKAYQIPFLGKASVDADHAIPVTDLMVSVRGNQVRLRSISLNKIIIPRLANAHNFTNPNSLDIYHFLCAIQSQNVRGSLNSLTSSFSSLFLFIPRLVLDNLILAEAQWRFNKGHSAPLAAAFKQNNWPALKAELDRWRQQYQIPRYICLVDADNELYVDLENQWLAEAFVNEIKGKQEFIIKEFLFRGDSAVVQSEKGWHTNQFVVAFRNVPETTSVTQVRPVAQPVCDPTTRKFFSGSEWLYYKVYTGIKAADWLLAEVLNPLIERFEATGWINKFFFIRYADPNGHIRIRFHVSDAKFIGEVIRELHDALAPYLESKVITSIVNDTYSRELERYGHNSIDAVEDYFYIDSRIILRFLGLIEGVEGDECRWRFGMKLTHDLLSLFGFDMKQRIAFTERQAAYFGKEFGYGSDLKKQLDTRYREIEGAIQELMDETSEEHVFFYDLCHQRSEQLGLMVRYVRSLQEQHALQVPLEGFLASLIHMTVNRLFRSRQRFVEYSIYYHLHKYYRIAHGRAMYAQPNVMETAL